MVPPAALRPAGASIEPRIAEQLGSSADAALRRLMTAGEAVQAFQSTRTLQDCHLCRYSCQASSAASCPAVEHLQLWDAEAYLKPAFYDSTWSGRPPTTAGLTVVSRGGRCAGHWKPQNQDSFLLHAFEASSTAAAAIVVGVFDGHGVQGAAAARAVREAMLTALEGCTLPPAAPAAAGAAALGGAVSQEVAESCLLQTFSFAEQRLGEAEQDFSKSGATAALCMLLGDRIVAAWAGDSRAVVGVRGSSGKGYQAHQLTADHKPESPSELARIAAAGGRVDRVATDAQGNPMGPYRIFVPDQWVPGLAVARAFGDTLASTVGVTAIPEFAVFPLPPPVAPAAHVAAPHAGFHLEQQQGKAAAADHRADSLSSSSWDEFPRARGRGSKATSKFGGFSKAARGTSAQQPQDKRLQVEALFSTASAPQPSHILVLATDGLWEFVSNQRAVDIAAGAGSAEAAAHALVEVAQREWAVKYRGRNCDDCTVAVAYL
ncbi:hypothetical protein N2152v2_008539 [Parachlorella kessleri]